jgi:tRNA(Arg) A34 adenosine deaminase TadA
VVLKEWRRSFAISQAVKLKNAMANLTKYNITAMIVDKRNRILSIGKNSYVKTHPIQAKHARRVGKENAVFLHAEIQAIIKCRNIEAAYKIIVTRYDSKGQPRLAKPCDICMDALKSFGINRIEHT